VATVNIVQQNGYLLCDGEDCSTNANHFYGAYHFWCPEIYKTIEGGLDAQLIQPGLRIIVPISVHAPDIWVTVSISSDALPNGSALMNMEFQPDLGHMKIHELGYWNPGEGRETIKRVITDLWKSKLDPKENWGRIKIQTKCPSRTHGLQQAVKMKEITSSEDRLKCLWNMVFEGACTPCIEASEIEAEVPF
jgi:hypothetical protein